MEMGEGRSVSPVTPWVIGRGYWSWIPFFTTCADLRSRGIPAEMRSLRSQRVEILGVLSMITMCFATYLPASSLVMT